MANPNGPANAPSPTAFTAPTFEVPVLTKHQMTEEYGLCALIGRGNLPPSLKRQMEDFSRWSSDFVVLTRYV
jgi:hypothetical protein